MNEEILELNQNIDRLNYLYFKSKSNEGLTEEEKGEQGILRERYIEFFKKKLEY